MKMSGMRKREREVYFKVIWFYNIFHFLQVLNSSLIQSVSCYLLSAFSSLCIYGMAEDFSLSVLANVTKYFSLDLVLIS